MFRPELYIVVAELLKKGADKERLYRALFNTYSENCLRLNAYAILNRMEVYPEDGAALIVLSRDELNRYHYAKGDTEGLVNRPLSIPGIHYSAFLREEADMVKVSMRSVGDFPVNILCKEYFGGGGDQCLRRRVLWNSRRGRHALPFLAQRKQEKVFSKRKRLINKPMKIFHIVAAVFALAFLASCEDGKSYAELLNEQDRAVNNFLADQVVLLDIPEDTIFEVGEDAPYYRLDEDGSLYMQVLNAGTEGNDVVDNEQIYFRYTRYNLLAYANGKLPQGGGNNLSLKPSWFRYNNFRIETSYQWGAGVQAPLEYLPVDCEVNLVVKSTQGTIDDQTDVVPFLYKLTYQRRE